MKRNCNPDWNANGEKSSSQQMHYQQKQESTNNSTQQTQLVSHTIINNNHNHSMNRNRMNNGYHHQQHHENGHHHNYIQQQNNQQNSMNGEINHNQIGSAQNNTNQILKQQQHRMNTNYNITARSKSPLPPGLIPPKHTINQSQIIKNNNNGSVIKRKPPMANNPDYNRYQNNLNMRAPPGLSRKPATKQAANDGIVIKKRAMLSQKLYIAIQSIQPNLARKILGIFFI